MQDSIVRGELARIGGHLPLVLDTIASLPRRIRSVTSQQQASAARTAVEISRNNIRNYQAALAAIDLSQVSAPLRERLYGLIRAVNGGADQLRRLPAIPGNLPVAAGAVIDPHRARGWTVADAVAPTLRAPGTSSTPSPGGAPPMPSRTPTLPGLGPSRSTTPTLPGLGPSRSTTPTLPGLGRWRSATPTLPGLGRWQSATPTLPGLGRWRSATPTLRGLGPPPGPSSRPAGGSRELEALDELIAPGDARGPGSQHERVAAASAPAFADALDRVVDPARVAQFARHRPGIDVAGMRTGFAADAGRAFATNLTRLPVAGRSPVDAGTAMGAIIAAAIAHAAARFPVIAPAAIGPMALAVHQRLRPTLGELTRHARAAGAAR